MAEAGKAIFIDPLPAEKKSGDMPLVSMSGRDSVFLSFRRNGDITPPPGKLGPYNQFAFSHVLANVVLFFISFPRNIRSFATQPNDINPPVPPLAVARGTPGGGVPA